MSQFFDQYNAILEKSLQRVRLKVDPSNKCAEDFAQFDGYVGYILAETDDSIEFFYDNQTVTIPKNAVVVEQGFWQGLAGNPKAAGVSGALGAITRQGIGAGVNALKGAANFGSMLYTGQKLFDNGTGSQFQGASAQRDKPVPAAQRGKPVPGLDKFRTYNIKDSNGLAAIEINGVRYGIVAGSIKNQSNQVLLNSFTFDNIYNRFLVEKPLTPHGTVGDKYGLNDVPTAQTTAQPTAQTTAQPTAQPATTQSQPQSGQATAAVQYVPMSKITAQNLKQQNALNIPLTLELLPIKSPHTSTPALHQVQFIVAPNSQEVILNFLQ